MVSRREFDQANARAAAERAKYPAAVAARASSPRLRVRMENLVAAHAKPEPCSSSTGWLPISFRYRNPQGTLRLRNRSPDERKPGRAVPYAPAFIHAGMRGRTRIWLYS